MRRSCYKSAVFSGSPSPPSRSKNNCNSTPCCSFGHCSPLLLTLLTLLTAITVLLWPAGETDIAERDRNDLVELVDMQTPTETISVRLANVDAVQDDVFHCRKTLKKFVIRGHAGLWTRSILEDLSNNWLIACARRHPAIRERESNHCLILVRAPMAGFV